MPVRWRFRDGPSRHCCRAKPLLPLREMQALLIANPAAAPRRRRGWGSTCPPRFQRLQALAETNSQAIPQLAPQPALLGMIRHTGVPLEPQVTLCHLLWNTSPRWRGTIRPPRFPAAVVCLPRVAVLAFTSQSLPGKPQPPHLTVSATFPTFPSALRILRMLTWSVRKMALLLLRVRAVSAIAPAEVSLL